MDDTQERQNEQEGRDAEVRPIAYSIAQACRAASISRTALYDVIARGDLPLHKFGRKSLILVTDLEEYIRSLPTTHSDKSA